MDRGLYIAASGMLAEQARQDQLANDLANASTPGYKADRVATRAFGDVLLKNSETGATVGGIGTGTRITGQETDLTPQALKQTDDPLDMGIEGPGFFAVQTAQGIRFTRNGQFRADAAGRLIDQLGNPVLGPDRRPVLVARDGTVAPTKVGVFDVTAARKAGDGTFTGTATNAPAGAARTSMLEGSGVDAAHAVIDMIGSMRAFEAGQRAITTIDETLRAASTQVGTLNG